MFERKRSDCAHCPLRDKPRVFGQGSLTSHVVVIGESPGTDESLKGQPFVGPAGQILNAGLACAKLPRDIVWATNLISCQPPKNDLGGWEGQQALVCCRPGLDDELEWLASKGVTTILACGTEPLNALGVEGGITKHRGSVYEVKSPHPTPKWMVPTYHPSYINRMRWGKGEGRKDLQWTWVGDIHKAKLVSHEGWTPPREDFNLYPTYDEVMTALSTSGALVSVDIETTGLTPSTGKIVVIGLGWDGERALSIPFICQGGKRYWSLNEDIDISHKLNEFFTHNRLVFHNALFDVRFLQGSGYTVPWSSVEHDTMLLHHVVTPESPHTLEFVVSTYGTTPYWKEAFKHREGSITSLDDTVLRTYNARDCVVLHQILVPLLADATTLGVLDVYRLESLGLLPVIAGMMDTGIRVDPTRLKAWRHHLEVTYDELERTLRSTGLLGEGFNLSSDEDLRWFLYGVQPPKFGELEGWEGKRKGTKVYEKLRLLQTVRDTKPLYLLRSYKGRKTETGKVAVNEQALLGLKVALENRLADVKKLVTPKPDESKAITTLLEWLATFNKFAEVEKLLSTYVDFPVGKDGRLHPSYLIHGTSTGRLSSRDPNAQNIPIKAQPLLGKCFTASPGCVLVQADYKSLEVGVLAYDCGDPMMIDDFIHERTHDENTKILFGIDKDNPLWKPGRAAAKVFQFGGLSYGGGDREIYEKVILKAPELHLTFSRFVEAKTRWMDHHPAYSKWKAEITEKAVSTRKVENAFGRVRTLGGSSKDIVKEALNFPIQSAAASIINRAMVRIHERLQIPVCLICQVHDSLLLDVPEGLVREVVELVKAEMERPVSFRGRDVSFPVEVEVGPSWGEMKGYQL